MPPDAVINTCCVVVTSEVVIGKLALICPCGTVTLAGTEATEAFELCRLTTVPPGGAALARITVPVAGCAPTGNCGVSRSEFSGSGPLNGALPPGNGVYSG